MVSVDSIGSRKTNPQSRGESTPTNCGTPRRSETRQLWRTVRQEEKERLSVEASVARPAFGGVEVAVQLPSRRVERRRPPKLRPSSDLKRKRLPVRYARAARLRCRINIRSRTLRLSRQALPSQRAVIRNRNRTDCLQGSWATTQARTLPYAASVGPFANNRAPVSMNLRVSSAKCLPSSASIWK